MLVKKKNSNAFRKQKIYSKRNSPPCIAVLHGSPFITITNTTCKFVPDLFALRSAADRTHFVDFDKMVGNIFGL